MKGQSGEEERWNYAFEGFTGFLLLVFSFSKFWMGAMAFGWIYHCLCFMSISGAMIEGARFRFRFVTSDSIMCGFLSFRLVSHRALFAFD